MIEGKSATDKHEHFNVYFYLKRYITDMDIDLKILLTFVLLTLICLYVPYLNESICRIAFGAAFALYLPGYAFMALIFPNKSDISSEERAVLSFVLSIAITPLIGLILNFTQWGVSLWPITLCLVIFTVACTLMANYRRHDVVEEERFSTDINKKYTEVKTAIFRSGGRRTATAVSVLIVVLVLVFIAQTSYMAITSKGGEKYTEFYITGPGGMFDNYSTLFTLGDQKPVTIGIANHEYEDMAYDLVVRLNNSTQSSIIYSGNMTLANNQTLEKNIDIKPDMVGDDVKLCFELYVDGNMTAPYRECHLWLNVTRPIE